MKILCFSFRNLGANNQQVGHWYELDIQGKEECSSWRSGEYKARLGVNKRHWLGVSLCTCYPHKNDSLANVKSVFLNDYLEEEVYVEQSLAFGIKNHEDT